MKVYRVENPVEEHGLWRNFDGSPCDVFDKLTHGKSRTLPMPDNDFYREGGKQWFAATDTPEKLREWFDILDIVQLRHLGYKVYQFEVSNVKTVSEYEVVFTRDSSQSVIAIDPADIWDEFDNRLFYNIMRETAKKIVKGTEINND